MLFYPEKQIEFASVEGVQHVPEFNWEQIEIYENIEPIPEEEATNFLGAKMYEPILEAIYAGLGIPSVIIDKESS